MAMASQRDLDPNSTVLPGQATTGVPAAAASALGVPVCPPSPTSTVSDYLSPNDSEMTDDDVGFTLVTKRRTKRHRRESSGSVSTIITSKTPAQLYTVLFSPGDAISVSGCNKVQLSLSLDSLTSGQITEIRVNQRKNVIAVDATTTEASALLLQQTMLCGIQVRAYLPRSINSLAGVIRGIDKDPSLEDLTSIMRTEAEILHVRRLGESTTTCIVFAGKKLPSHVKVGYVRYSVWPYESRPLQCQKCHKLGHSPLVLRTVRHEHCEIA